MNVKPLLISVCLLPVTTFVFAGIPTVDNTETVIYKANTYSIYDASLWSADGPGQLSVDWAISEQQWDSVFGRPPSARLGVGQVINECFLGVCVKAGAAAGIEATAYVLPYLKADLNPGTFDATVAYQPSVTYQFGGLGIDFFKLNTSDGFDASSSEFIVYAPSIKLETGLNISADLNLFAEACLLGCFVDETHNLVSADFTLPLIQIDTLASEAKVFSPPTNVLELVALFTDLVANPNPPSSFDELANSVLYKDVSAVLGRVSEAQWDKYKEDLKTQSDQGDNSAKDKLDKIEKAESLIAASPLSLEFSNPYTSNAEGQWGGSVANPQAIDVATANMGGDFLDLRLDVDKVLGYAFGLPNGGTLSLDDMNIKNSPIDVELTLFDIQAGPSINLETALTLSPELMVNIEFSAPVLIKGEIGKQTHYYGNWDNIPDIALLPPEAATNVGEYTNTGIVTATPTFSVEASLSNRTYIDVAAAVEISGLGASIGIDGFGDLSIGPVFNYNAESDSLAQIDVYNETFSTGTWNSASATDINNGSDRTRPNGQASLDTNPLSEALRFDPSGEIVFQARSKTSSNDVAKNDARVKQFLNTNALINADIAMRGYEDKAWENLDINVNRLFDFKEPYGNVRFNIEDRFKIDVGQHGQVMSDGQFEVSKSDFFTVERGGTLELGAANPYGGATGQNTGPQGAYGFINKGTTRIEGDAYIGGDAIAQGDPERYKFINTGGGANLTVGTQGKLKFDGTFENQSSSSGVGFVNNSGNFELTADNNKSSGAFRNFYGAELDLFGSLAVYEATNTDSGGIFNSFRDLYNNGTVTLYSGAQLELRGGEELAYAKQATDFLNNGELIIKKGSEFVLSANDSGVVLTSPQYQSVDKAIFENLHIVKNEGLIRNDTGQLIINGKEGSDWQAYRNSGDPLEYARQLRNNALADKPANYKATSDKALNAANDARIARVDFASKTQQYINDSKIFVESNSQSALTDWRTGQETTSVNYESQKKAYAIYESFLAFSPLSVAPLYEAYLATFKNYTDALEEESRFKGAFEENVNDLSLFYEFFAAGGVRKAEDDYKLALNQLGVARGDEYNIRNAIDAIIDTGTGVGVMVNGKGGLILNSGELVNNAVLVNSTSGEIYNDTGGLLVNAGGYLQNNGLLVNQAGAQLTNSGVIDNSIENIRNAFGILDIAQIVNLGTLTNQGELVNNDTLVNYGVMNNQTQNNAANEALINNSGKMSNLGQINNDAQLINDSGAELNNHGKIVNNGTITNDGIFNNGQVGKGSTLSVANVIANALSFYRQKQTISSLGNASNRLEEQVKDSRAREGLVKLQQIPLVSTGNSSIDSFWNDAIKGLNITLRTVYNIGLAAAKANTAVYETTYAVNSQGIANANATMMGLDSVATKSYTDANGNMVTGSPYINLAAIGSVNTAKLENNGTIVNRGLLNNVGTITNNADGQIRNSGILMLGKQGLIDNAGTLALESGILTSVDVNGNAASFEQTGMLISNGTINNSNLIDISAGTLVNGTLAERSAVINNSGDIRLSASADLVLNAETGKETLVYSTASLINQASINNQSGGLIQIGQSNPLIQANGLESINMLVNFGQINNQDGASIENNGMLYNAGSIDNQAGSSFTSTGVINNAATGDISFAEAATVGGDVINNGFINMADGEILTLTGGISGNGTFAGSTMLNGASVNPGNSPGLLTFAGDVVAQNVNWIMEIWGTERGVGYDAVDILGDFTVVGDMSFSILSLLDFDTIIAQDFNLFSVSGQLFGELGQMITESFAFVGFNDEMANNWSGNWIKNLLGGWNLNLSFIGNNVDLYADLPTLRVLDRFQNTPTDVPEPGPLSLLLIGLSVLWWRSVAVKKQSVSTTGLQ